MVRSATVQQLLTEREQVERMFQEAGFVLYPTETVADPHGYAIIFEKAHKIIIHKK
jgi:hypothetical protein